MTAGGTGLADLALGHFSGDGVPQVLCEFNVTESFNATRLVKHLLTLRTTSEAPLRDRILTLDQEITTLDATLATQESKLNAITYQLYGLTPEEIAMVEGG